VISVDGVDLNGSFATGGRLRGGGGGFVGRTETLFQTLLLLCGSSERNNKLVY